MKKQPVTMGRVEALLGIIYLMVQIFFLPVILVLGNSLLPRPFDDAQLNFICFALNFICVTVIFHRYLLRSLQIAFADPGSFFKICGLGFAFYWICSIVVNMLVLYVDPEFSNVNDDSILQISKSNFMLMTVGTVLLVPVVEETLFRGVIFGQLMRKNQVLAYILSIAIFSAIHVVGYIGLYPPVRLLLCLIQYFPAAFFLAWAFEKSNTIWSPILIHTVVNLIGMMSMK